VSRSVEELIATADIYGEGVGGLGDLLLRFYFTGEAWYSPLASLPRGSHAVFALMCHNPYAAEIFKWHPARKQIHVIDLGFTTPFHPWENRDWRVAQGLPPEAPCPPHAPAQTLQFYPSPADLRFIEKVKSGGRYVVMAATAGDPKKSIPDEIRASVMAETANQGAQCVVVGRGMYLNREGRSSEIPATPGVVSAIDQLSVPGTIELVKGAAGVVSSDTSVLHAAWQEHRPVFLLYNQWTLETLIPHGPVGYMQGIDRKDTDHMTFGAYTEGRYRKWLEAR
jgi:ADP-heptose:LPS heptosyltransferase